MNEDELSAVVACQEPGRAMLGRGGVRHDGGAAAPGLVMGPRRANTRSFSHPYSWTSRSRIPVRRPCHHRREPVTRRAAYLQLARPIGVRQPTPAAERE